MAVEDIKPYAQSSLCKTKQIETMFNKIARRYDLLNCLMSFGIDKQWRRKAIQRLSAPQQVLDVATGTGDFALAILNTFPQARVTGIDLSEEMLQVARKKAHLLSPSIDGERWAFSVCDAAHLPFGDCTYDAITIAFGIRNFESINDTLLELRRVLRPHGKIVVLELSTPKNAFVRAMFRLHANIVIPFIGWLISGEDSAYCYLPASIAAFPQGEEMKIVFEQAGFSDVSFTRFTLGACTLYEGHRLN